MQILSNETLKEMYPRSLYDQKTPYVKKHVFHFLLAQGYPDGAVITHIQKINDLTKLVRKDDTRHELTPLIIAIMQGREKVVKALLDIPLMSMSFELTDTYGWTPVHHAAVSTQAIRKLFREALSNKNKLTHALQSVQELQDLTQRDVKPISVHTVFYQDSEGNLIPIKEIDIKKLFELEEYRDLPYYGPEQGATLWKQTSPKGDINRLLAFNGYKKYFKNPPNLVIAPCPHFSGYELRAGEDLPIGTVIGVYSGEVVSKTSANTLTDYFTLEKFKHRDYQYDRVNAIRIGGATRFANCGWPNIQCFPKGDRDIFVVADEIKKDQPILYDYGFSSYGLSCGILKILGRDDMHRFFSPDLESVTQEIFAQFGRQLEESRTIPSQDLSYANLREYLKFELMMQRLVFPLNQLNASLDLHYSNIISVESWLYQIHNAPFPFIKDWMKNANPLFFTFTEHIIAFDRCVKMDKARQWILNSIGKLSLVHILKGMKEIKNAVEKGSLNEKNWEPFCKKLEEDLKTYEIQSLVGKMLDPNLQLTARGLSEQMTMDT